MNKVFETFSFSGSSVNCYGLEVVKRNLIKYGINCIPFSKDSKNPILFSLYWPEQIFDFIKWRYQSFMKDRIVIVGGNTATTNPSAIMPFCDYIFLGDGENWNGSFESDYLINCKNPEKKKISICKDISPFEYEDVQSNRRSFCEISRGCKNKCLFCQYGWLKPYRECDIENIKVIIKSAKTKSIRFFSADRFQHSRYLDIRAIIQKKGSCDTGSDMSIKYILKHPDFLKYTKKVRVGVEGMSERLRSLVGKKYTNDELITFIKLISDSGIKCLDFYMIYGLPTEQKEDIEQFKELLLKFDLILPFGYVIAIHWNAFTPSAMTPFQWESSSFNYNANNINKILFHDLGNKRIKVYNKPKLTSDKTILSRMLAIRGGIENAKLIYNFAFNKPAFLKQPDFILKQYLKETGMNLVGEWKTNSIMPWDEYVEYRRDSMLRIKELNYGKFGR